MTPSILYGPSSAITLENFQGDKESVYLSQCAGFYLEAAAHAHERVYNLGPSFRNESRTNRHLMEYWHIKAELASGNLDGIIKLVEYFLQDVFEDLQQNVRSTSEIIGSNAAKAPELPFKRIPYRDVVEQF